jgi:hypothetical protein
MFSNFIFENRTVYETIRKKYWRVGQATDDNMTHAHFMLDTWGYKHTLKICNTYNNGYTNALNVALYVYCLSCCVIYFFNLQSVSIYYTRASMLILQLPIHLFTEHVKNTVTELKCYVWSMKPFSESFSIPHPVYSVTSWYQSVSLGL